MYSLVLYVLQPAKSFQICPPVTTLCFDLCLWIVLRLDSILWIQLLLNRFYIVAVTHNFLCTFRRETIYYLLWHNLKYICTYSADAVPFVMAANSVSNDTSRIVFESSKLNGVVVVFAPRQSFIAETTAILLKVECTRCLLLFLRCIPRMNERPASHRFTILRTFDSRIQHTCVFTIQIAGWKKIPRIMVVITNWRF